MMRGFFVGPSTHFPHSARRPQRRSGICYCRSAPAPDSEAQLRPHVQAVVALVAVGEAAVVADPGREVRAELRIQADARTAPGLVGYEARHSERARHVDQACTHLARI